MRKFCYDYPSKPNANSIKKTLVSFNATQEAIMTTYAYCRVSTTHQKLSRQITNITAIYPTATIIKEFYTGTKQDRPSWNKLMSQIKSGDTIVFDSVSRMSRNAGEGFKDYKMLYESGVNLIFLNEPLINTSVFDQAEKEVTDLHSRISQGIREAKKNGTQIGLTKGSTLTTKKSIECKAIIQKHSKDFGGSLNDPDVIKLCGCSRNSYYKYKRELKAFAIGSTQCS